MPDFEILLVPVLAIGLMAVYIIGMVLDPTMLNVFP